MSDTATADDTTAEMTWAKAVIASAVLTLGCLAFSYAWEAIAQAMGDF